MADILIRGMGMPIHCSVCPLSVGSGSCSQVMDPSNTAYYAKWRGKGRPDWCPLVPLPEGHGRLIDADLLREDWLENGENEHVYDTNAMLYSIDNSPTIVPAEGGDN